ncbi:NADH-ubiquinone oxidoreductase subunit NDUFA12 family protein [Candidatus Bandiella euplotis]|uniref:NADH:ubiquinone oxidoreductase subunit n=1 Tax=Candidatus Bandiella euplotis TaxID=1664265 RepID=A0ABZ0UNV9_9RICK|nr:NADH-ubiquinone oxidoreductase subunit NDUFA12 family protein [Candidatus Bandiella woodruffii]WPX96946.1 NADH:ubiquinone oxidoreductase subunit [Candidatus Bandiella woodruffii]
MELANWVYCRIFGNKVAVDEYGNVFYESKKASRYFGRPMRWVYYNGIVEPTKIAPKWHAWLHHQSNIIPSDKDGIYSKENDRKVNLTGTKFAYYPPGHFLAKFSKPVSTGDYHAWRPPE